MPAAADDHDIIAPPRCRLAPSRIPVPVPGQRVPGKREKGIALHARQRSTAVTGTDPAGGTACTDQDESRYADVFSPNDIDEVRIT